MRSFLLAVSIVATSFAAALALPTALGGKWRIVAVSGAEALDASRTHAEFAGDRFASTVGCNRIFGRPAIAESQLSFGPMASTRMACPPPLDGVERQYLAALQDVSAYRLEGSTLVFLNAAGDASVTLEREK
jgi:heat shock protein HslJ